MGKDKAIKRPTLNPDGVSVKGCAYIYAPRGQAGEYAALATNPYRGCGHGCAYCYVPLVIKMPRKDFDAGATPRPNFLIKLRKDAAKYQTLSIYATHARDAQSCQRPALHQEGLAVIPSAWLSEPAACATAP